MNRKDLQTLSRVRLREAQALLKMELYSGAYYLAGYSVECALKSCLARETNRYDFPDKQRVNASYTHSLEQPVKVAELNFELQKYDQQDSKFQFNWRVTRQWSEEPLPVVFQPEGNRTNLCNIRAEAWSDRMGQTILVDVDMALGAQVLRALDDAKLRVKIALWVHLPQYDDWRFAVYSRMLDTAGIREAFRLVDDALRAGGIPVQRTPIVMFLKANDPLVKGLRRMFPEREYVEGTRLNDQPVGDRWVNAAYLYRVS